MKNRKRREWLSRRKDSWAIRRGERRGRRKYCDM
jgi:hypothetical protein